MELIIKYFPEISDRQQAQFAAMQELYARWNTQINVISRQDMVHFYERHVLHSLSIAKQIQFTDGTKVLDFGTGGGFPGIPLAVLFPSVSFVLVDSIGKKIKVVKEVAAELGLQNITAHHCRVEEVDEQFDFAVCRAVKPLETILSWIRGKISRDQKNDAPNGLLALKGGDLSDEMKACKKPMNVYPISNFFAEPFFETKKIVHVRL